MYRILEESLHNIGAGEYSFKRTQSINPNKILNIGKGHSNTNL
jgi:hypothetical protein